MKKRYRRREFLNTDEHRGDAFISVNIKAKTEKEKKSVYGIIKITDCMNDISLEIGGGANNYHETTYKNSLYKIDKLIEVLQETRENFIMLKNKKQ